MDSSIDSLKSGHEFSSDKIVVIFFKILTSSFSFFRWLPLQETEREAEICSIVKPL